MKKMSRVKTASTGFKSACAWFRGFTSLGGLTQARDTDNQTSR